MGKQKHLKILVTGGGGFVGHALIKRLKVEGYELSSFSRQTYSFLDQLEVNQISGNLGSFNAVMNAVKDHDIVFHVAAKAGFWGSPKEYHEANVLGTNNIIKACQDSNVSKLIFTSSASVVFGGEAIENGDTNLPYPNIPLNNYTATKALSEQAVLKANSDKLKTISLRPHIIWGPGDRHIIPRLLDRAKSGRLQQIGDGKNRIDTIYIDNFIDAQLLAIKALDENPVCRGKAYFLTNDEPVLLWKFLNDILVAAKYEPISRVISQNTALILARVLTGLHHIFLPKKEPALTSFLVKELSQSHWFNISEAKKELGYSPKISLKEGLIKLFDK